MKRTNVLLLVLVLAALLVAGCAKPAQEEGSLPVFKYVNFMVYDPVYVALDLGFFHERGLEVQIIGDVLAGPTGIQAVASGMAQGGLSSIPAIINANAAGLPIYGSSDIQSAVGTQPLEEYFVRADSGIDSIEDLRGKKVAVNLWRSSFHYTLLMALEQHGIPESEVEFVLLSFDKQAIALETGQVDLIGLMEPYASHCRATQGDAVRVLFDAIDVFGTKQFCTHFLNRVWAENNPELARAFTDGIVDAILWIHEHPDEAKPIIAKYTKVDEQYVPAYLFQENGVVVEEDVRFWYDYLVQRGDLTATWMSVEDIAGNKYNSRAAED